MTFLPSNSQGLFLDPTLIIPDDEVDKQYLVKDRYTQIADCVNIREVGSYQLVEVETGLEYFTPGNPQKVREGWRKVIQVGTVTGGAPGTTVNHGINDLTTLVKWEGWGDDGTNFYVLPYVDAAGTGNVSIDVTATQVTVTSGATGPTLPNVYVVLDYLKGT